MKIFLRIISNARKEIETQENLPLTGEINNSVLDMLKGWRRISSQKENVPAYCILNDRTLKELAIKIPENIHELENIHGIGSSKIEKYGKDILKIVNYKG
jgi:ATP-dependent DNA helicase RecQ